MTTITVLGAGCWGSALALQLASNQHQVYIWDHDPQHVRNLKNDRQNKKYLPGIAWPDNLYPVNDMASYIKQSDYILVAVPSFAFHQVILKVKSHLTQSVPLVWGTKGVEPKQKKFLHDIVSAEFGKDYPYAVLAGPSFAKEVALQQPTAVTIASLDIDYAKKLSQVFHSATFRPYTSTDVMGAEVGGLVKNVLAIAIGIADGLGYGANTRAAMITRGLHEMLTFGLKLGAQAATLYGLTGMGDLILTATDNQSRNRRFGLALGQGKTVAAAKKIIGQVIEGCENAELLYQISQKLKVEMPICSQVFAIIAEQLPPPQAVKNLLDRALKSE
ncbi:MAG: NAD(P)H-dependent glycerol-3-phosphate dehydrogenase [Pseudomonadota bacterium]